MSKILLETLKGNPGDRVPFWFMRQAGRYLPEYRKVRETTPSFLDFCYTPEKAEEVTLQPIRRYGMDGAILFADILVVPDGLGQKVWFEQGVGPRLDPIATEKAFANLSMSGFHDKMGSVYKTVSRLSNSLPDNVTLIGFAGSPWTVATYMIGGQGSKDHAAARQLGYGNPELFGKILDILVDSTAEYLCAQIEAGAEVVQIFDSWSAALPETMFEKWVIEPTKAIVEKIRAKHSETPIIGFPRLAGLRGLRAYRYENYPAHGPDFALPIPPTREGPLYQAKQRLRQYGIQSQVTGRQQALESQLSVFHCA